MLTSVAFGGSEGMKPFLFTPLVMAFMAAHLTQAADELFHGPNTHCRAMALEGPLIPADVPRLRKLTAQAVAEKDGEGILNLTWIGADPEWVRGTRWYEAAVQQKLYRSLIAGAATGDNDKVLAALDKGADINVNLARNMHMGPLIWAAGCNHVDTVDLLLRRGANVNGTATWDSGMEGAVEGETPLIFAAFYAQHDAVRLLLSRGANPNAQNTVIPDLRKPERRKWDTPLLASGSAETTEILLAHRADPNLVHWDGTSPLMLAAEAGWTAVVEMLLAHGASPTLRNADGLTAADLARKHNHPAVANLIDAWNGGPARSR